MATTQMRVVIEDFDKWADLVVKKIALDIAANLRARPDEGGTPVDTGWARANWVPRIGVPFEDLVGTRPKDGETAVDTESPAGSEAVAAGYKIDLGAIYVSNNVHYIERLNEGSSTQAPAGFIQAAIAKAVTTDFDGFLPPSGGGLPTDIIR